MNVRGPSPHWGSQRPRLLPRVRRKRELFGGWPRRRSTIKDPLIQAAASLTLAVVSFVFVTWAWRDRAGLLALVAMGFAILGAAGFFLVLARSVAIQKIRYLTEENKLLSRELSCSIAYRQSLRDLQAKLRNLPVELHGQAAQRVLTECLTDAQRDLEGVRGETIRLVLTDVQGDQASVRFVAGPPHLRLRERKPFAWRDLRANLADVGSARLTLDLWFLGQPYKLCAVADRPLLDADLDFIRDLTVCLSLPAGNGRHLRAIKGGQDSSRAGT